MLDKLPTTVVRLQALAIMSHYGLIVLTDKEKIDAWDSVYTAIPELPTPTTTPEPELPTPYNPYSYLDKLKYKTSHMINVKHVTIRNITLAGRLT